ncbi:hypothetical protein P775_05060 [Puniceibacterium antarcticum]|uniref:Inosine/uridine-preferring nucleoside hydrolase domain-containing protein n=1 Tax=Puniceibacterium antarcticum TaxID=1206336 RepID=A0A2G8RIM8_9RHOB|nr:nucleoside hydrolase [Puniceibacterium antarcticum]PIL21362.1 hypothetical protein P775_05060 [Puniceibacterium antarcticum]
MTSVWVDTDMGFDDLWALRLLHRHNITPTGVSVVAGNVPRDVAIANARGAAQAFDLPLHLYAGAERPLQRTPETAERILGAQGMPTRGRSLPQVAGETPPDAVTALADWLLRSPVGSCTLLALGPLSTIAQLVLQAPDAAARLGRLVWMGGSAGPGNHSPRAEFNALGDPHAADIVARAGLPLDVIDLMLCRTVTFGTQDLPKSDPLTTDLLGGYLDIALSRGRARMAIYDPVAALALVAPELFEFAHKTLHVSCSEDDSFGETSFAPDIQSRCRLAVRADAGVAARILAVLAES